MITSILATLSLALSSIFGVFHAPSFGATGFNVQQGGTGSTTLGGILKGNGTSGIGSVVVGSNLSWDGTTLSASGGGSGFSTTSADYWKTVNNFFSTTSADYWETQQAARGGSSGFSTTSANYWSSLGLSFSTTSANAWRSTLWENNFPFTPQTWGNSTTSVMGFLTGGIVVNAASSTFSGATTTFTNAVQIGASASGQHRLSVMPSASQMDGSGFSTGGAVFIDTTNTGGSALNLHTSFGTGSLGRLFNVICDSTTFDSECANIQSNGPAVSALGVIGSSTNKGVIKASSRSTQGSASADANAAVYSGDIAGDNTPGSTAAQGYFMFSTGSTTGNLLTLRDPNTDRFVVDANGRTRIGATTTFDGLLTLSKLANFTFATSSFYSTGGLDLTAGCFSIRGTCISGSSGTDIQFSTTSADYYTSLGLSFSTTSADAWKGARNFFSTTSADYYKSVNNYFSTTSADYWKTQNNFFSTTSANYWASLGLAFSTTSAANYFINGLAFSTTTNNTFTGSNIFQGSTTLFSFTSINGTTTNFAITGLATAAGTVLAVDPTGRVIATTTSGSTAGNIATGTPSGTINGSNTAFTVSATPTLVLLNGAYQTPGEDYTYGSGTITFTVAPPTGSNLRYVYNVNGLTITASGSAGNCAQWITSSSLGDSGLPCGSGAGSSFSTTSANYWSSLGLAFSTTSTDYWQTQRNFFSTTSANLWGNSKGYVATSAVPTLGNLSYWTGAGTPSTLGTVATTSLTASGALALSQPISVIGTSASALTCTNSSSGVTGCLTGTDWDTFNGKQATILATWPIIKTGSTLSFGGLSTSTAAVQGNIPYFSGVNTFANVATGTLAASGLLSVTAGQSIIGSGATVSLSNVAANTVLGNNTGASAAPVAFATSTFFGATTAGFVVAWDGTKYTPMATATCVQITGSAALCDGDDATAAGGDSFSTTSANYWSTLGLGFSTTSANLWGNSKGYVATSTVPTIGNLAMWTGIGTPSTLGTVATSTPTISAPLTYSGTLGNFVGGVGGAFSIPASTNTVDGYLTAADHLLLSGKASTSTTLGLSLDALLSTNSSGVMVSTSSPAFSTFFATSTTGTSTINNALRFGTTSATRDNMLQIDCSGRIWPASVSVGGCVSIDEGTLPQFPALFIKGNSGSGAGGQLVNIIQSGTAVDQDMMFASSSGSNVTAFGIRGMPTGKGVLKINFTGGGTGFSNGAGISVDTTPSDAQGIFIKTGTGIPLNILDSSSNTLFRVDSQGNSTTTGFAQINGGFISQASSTFNGNATTTGTFFATNASSTKTFGANLSSCTGSNFLQWNAGLFSCAAGGGGSFAYPFSNITFGAGVNAFGTTTIDFPAQFATGSSTIGTLVATSSITNKSVTSALILNGAGGLEGAYAGSNPCTNQVALSLSATGVITCTSISDAMFTGQLGISHGGTNASSFTSGSVLYYTGSAFGENNSNFFWNNSATALGLGTTTPRWALTVSSSTAPQLTLTDASATNNPWTFRSVAGSLFISTSSPSTFATSTNAAISILPSTLSGLLVGATTTNALSTLNTTAVAAFLNEPVGNGTAASSTLVVGDTSTTTSRSQVQLNSSNGTTFCIYVSNAGTLTSTSGKCN